jgi:hypothetical protein
MSGFARQPVYLGTGPQNLEGQGLVAASNVAYPVETYQTPLIDFTKIQLGIELVPARPVATSEHVRAQARGRGQRVPDRRGEDPIQEGRPTRVHGRSGPKRPLKFDLSNVMK